MTPLSRLFAALALFSALAPGVARADFAGPPFLPPIGIAQGGAGAYGVLYSAAGTAAAAGTGYAPGDAATLTGGIFTTAGVVAITDTKAVAGTVAAAGTGGANGACTVTGTTGTGTLAQFSGTVSGGALTGPLTVAVAGDYTVNPTLLSAEPVTGCSLTGAQVNMSIGALTYAVQRPGVYSAVPANPVAQGSSSGAGTGATFTLSFGPISQSYPGLTPGGGSLYIGNQAGQAETTGTENTFVGFLAGGFATTGQQNSAFGHHTMGAETTGQDNAAFGTDAMRDTAGVSFAAAFGQGAMRDWNCSSCTMLGQSAGQGKTDGTTTGTNIVAVGNQAVQGNSATTASRIVGIGLQAGQAVTTSTDSTLIGHTAGLHVTSGVQSTFVGSQSGGTPTTGNGITLLGYNSNATAVGVNDLVAIGGASNGGGNGARGGSQSVVIGAKAGNGSLSGTGIYLGYQVAQTNCTTGNGNIILGNAADCGSAGQANFLNIGGLVEGDLSIGHFVLNGTAPGVTAGSTDCGTSPAISGNDNVGLVTVGSSTNGSKCTVTFHTAWTTAPVCLALNQTTGNLLRPASTTTTLVLNGTLTASDKLSYMCKGYQL